MALELGLDIVCRVWYTSRVRSGDDGQPATFCAQTARLVGPGLQHLRRHGPPEVKLSSESRGDDNWNITYQERSFNQSHKGKENHLPNRTYPPTYLPSEGDRIFSTQSPIRVYQFLQYQVRNECYKGSRYQ